MLTKAAQYAVRAMIYLSVHSSERKKVNARVIAEKLDVPSPFLSKLLQQLSRANLVSSSKGPQGGFFLTKEDLSNTVWEVIICIEGEEKFNSCVMGLPECSNDHPCVFHHSVSPFRRRIMNQFDDKTFAQIAKDFSGDEFSIVKI